MDRIQSGGTRTRRSFTMKRECSIACNEGRKQQLSGERLCSCTGLPSYSHELVMHVLMRLGAGGGQVGGYQKRRSPSGPFARGPISQSGKSHYRVI